MTSHSSYPAACQPPRSVDKVRNAPARVRCPWSAKQTPTCFIETLRVNVIFDVYSTKLFSSLVFFVTTYTPKMFGAPPQPSKQELDRAEAQTMSDIKWTAASAVVLYLSPFLVDYVYKLI
ncbi:hypothetical protein OPT61_g7570 [Boeremia exigua]|uniref:Uncharacterized protein n=1 Tax=Boeremia exigua TaxID=749465 RepID=A0ACC2I247_9PLEO|nr:hypothetical protein OPT61_g7570 [Boeremia exigua]